MTPSIECLDSAHGENWSMYHGDCVEVVRQMPEASVDLAVYSPPFSSLFVYSDNERDMGNVSGDDEFFEAYGFIVRELLRVLKPGRLAAVHVSDLPARKGVEGYIGLRDFSGLTVMAHEQAGFYYHGRVTVWKNPVTEMQRTKALGLLWKQLRKDSTMSRPGMADYVLLFRKPGDNAVPVTHTQAEFPVEQWQQWASPVWMDINQSDTLNVAIAREAEDERHMCPLQLPLIRRVVTLYSNPGDVVLSPFGGVGSEGFGSVQLGRRYVGVELKESYFKRACRNLTDAENIDQLSLFG